MATIFCGVAAAEGMWTNQAPLLSTPRPSLLPDPKTGLLGDCPPEYRNQTNTTDNYGNNPSSFLLPQPQSVV